MIDNESSPKRCSTTPARQKDQWWGSPRMRERLSPSQGQASQLDMVIVRLTSNRPDFHLLNLVFTCQRINCFHNCPPNADWLLLARTSRCVFDDAITFASSDGRLSPASSCFLGSPARTDRGLLTDSGSNPAFC